MAQRPSGNALGRLVRARRDDLRLTQEDVARELGVERSYIGHIESGRIKQPSREMLAQLSRILGIPLHDLAVATYSAGQQEPVTAPGPDEAETRMIVDVQADPYLPEVIKDVLQKIVREEYRRWREEHK